MFMIDLDKENIDQIGRHLRKLNMPDDEIIHVHRSGLPCFVDAKASVWKGLSIQENQKTGPRFVKYVPMPDLWGKNNVLIN